MFCPACKNEYRDGFYACPDCSLDLVYALPTPVEESTEAGANEHDYREVARIPYIQVPYIDSLLVTSDIVYHFEQSRGAKGQVLDSVLWVEKSCVDDVVALLDALEKDGSI